VEATAIGAAFTVAAILMLRFKLDVWITTWLTGGDGGGGAKGLFVADEGVPTVVAVVPDVGINFTGDGLGKLLVDDLGSGLRSYLGVRKFGLILGHWYASMGGG